MFHVVAGLNVTLTFRKDTSTSRARDILHLVEVDITGWALSFSGIGFPYEGVYPSTVKIIHRATIGRCLYKLPTEKGGEDDKLYACHILVPRARGIGVYFT